MTFKKKKNEGFGVDVPITEMHSQATVIETL